MDRRRFIRLAGASAVAASAHPMWAAGKDRVIVVGAGIIGASTAYHLAKRGAKVTLIEKERPAAGTTKNSFAWFNSSGKSPRSYYELNLAGMAGWRRLELEIGPELPLQWGGSIAWTTPDAKLEAARKLHLAERESWGYSVRQVDTADMAHLVPGVTPGPIGFAQFADQEGTVDPVVAAEVLTAKAKAHGATVMYPCEITGMDLAGGRLRGVTTTQGKLEADYLIIAAGNATPAIAAMAGMTVPLIESRGILAHGKPQPRALNRIIMPPGADVKQNLDGRIVTGLNFGESGDTPATDALGAEYFDKLSKFLPAAAATKLDYMTLGHRVMPKDGHPIMDRAAGYPNVYAVAMHSGMTCAPIVGQLVSMEVLDQVSVDMLSSYRLSRFS